MVCLLPLSFHCVSTSLFVMEKEIFEMNVEGQSLDVLQVFTI